VDTLALRIDHKEVEDTGEASPTGFVRLEQGPSSAVLLTPEEIDPQRRYPLVTVLHGAGRMDEMLVKASRDAPAKRDALFLIPRSVEPTWDLIVGGEDRPDLDFLEYAYDLIYRRYPVDAERQALIGYSDGASYAISIALANPGLFDAAMCWAAGFAVADRGVFSRDQARPRVYMEHGTHDPLFPFEQIAIPLRDNLERAGCDVTFSVDEGGKHMPSGSFQDEALDWYFGQEA
jgi:predicted esterase